MRTVREAGRVSLAHLAEVTGVSEMTVRRDLDELTERGLLRRVRGGAVSLDVVEDSPHHADPHHAGDSSDTATTSSTTRSSAQPPTRTTTTSRSAGSPSSGFPSPSALSAVPTPSSPPASPRTRRETGLERAGRVVAEQVPAGGTVLLDSGPGAVEVAAHLAHRSPLTVAVTSLEAAVVLAGSPGIRLVVLGGETRAGEPGLLGPTALAALADLHLDLFVMTPAGLDGGTGCWARSPDAAALARAALARTDRAVAVADTSVLGRRSLVHVAPLSSLAQVITPTDDDLTAVPALRDVRDAGPVVLLA